MREEHQIEANRIRNKKNYYIRRAIQDKEKLKMLEEEVRIRNRDIALMNEVRLLAEKVLNENFK
jgi:hypothetical protein